MPASTRVPRPRLVQPNHQPMKRTERGRRPHERLAQSHEEEEAQAEEAACWPRHGPSAVGLGEMHLQRGGMYAMTVVV